MRSVGCVGFLTLIVVSAAQVAGCGSSSGSDHRPQRRSLSDRRAAQRACARHPAAVASATRWAVHQAAPRAASSPALEWVPESAWEPARGGRSTGDAAAQQAKQARASREPPNCDPTGCRTSGEPATTRFVRRHRHRSDGVPIADLVGAADGYIRVSAAPARPYSALPSGTALRCSTATASCCWTAARATSICPITRLRTLNRSNHRYVADVEGRRSVRALFSDFGVGAGEIDSTGQGSSYLAVATYGLDQTKLQLLTRQEFQPPMKESIRSFADMNDQLEHQVAAVFVEHLARRALPRRSIARPRRDRLAALVDHRRGTNGSAAHNGLTITRSMGTWTSSGIYGQALTPCAIQALYESASETSVDWSNAEKSADSVGSSKECECVTRAVTLEA